MSEWRFEELREAIAEMPNAGVDGRRTVRWLSSERALGVCRDGLGRIEIILPGPPLTPWNRTLLELFESGPWTDPRVGTFEATRFVLPSGEHLDAVGAMICVELLRNGIETERGTALDRTEPVIALALSRLHLGNQALVGLVGEMVALRALVLSAAPNLANEIVASWAGSGRSTRDIQLRNVGIEVKTTTRATSIHHIQGLAQVEPGVGVGNEHESALYLLSLGIRWLDGSSSAGEQLPDVVESIIARLDADGTAAFLDSLQTYGGDVGIGYRHERDQRKMRYRRPFVREFERLYDMGDDKIQVPRLNDISHRTHLDRGSLSFRIELPDSVDGDINPIVGLSSIASQVLRTAGVALP